MARPNHLTNAPIVEALVDVRVQFPQLSRLGALDAIHEKIKERYPDKATIHKIEQQLQLSPGGTTHETREYAVLGFRFDSRDKTFIFQARTDGFTVSQLPPYTKWSDLLDEAKMLWPVYAEAARPEAVTRVAVRYINRLKIPLPIIDFAEYLTSPPIIPGPLPQQLASFLTRFVILDEPKGITAILTQAFDGPTGPIAGITLDIDVFREASYNAEADEWWDLLETMREVKNTAFFSSITDKTVEMFK